MRLIGNSLLLIFPMGPLADFVPEFPGSLPATHFQFGALHLFQRLAILVFPETLEWLQPVLLGSGQPAPPNRAFHISNLSTHPMRFLN